MSHRRSPNAVGKIVFREKRKNLERKREIVFGLIVLLLRNVKQVDPSRLVQYRSGFVFERVTAGQVRAGYGPQND